jgi:hypothetical protein
LFFSVSVYCQHLRDGNSLKKRRPAGEQQAFGLSYNHNKAVHKSDFDLCHHHAMFENLTMIYASDFFLGVDAFFCLAAPCSAVAVPGLRDAVLFNFALIAFRLRAFPYEPFVIFPFLDFLSPLPIR